MNAALGLEQLKAMEAASRIFDKVEKCLRQGCIIQIEHASTIAPRFTPWEIWGKPSCYNGDVQQVYAQIEACREAHGDHHIRLSIEDFSCHSRFSFVVHRPLPMAA
ncbi:MAG: ribulose bisphosphate carboxylase small subunit [Gammaproteobacteria bacterium]